MKVYTIGHSTRTAEELIALLCASAVDLLVDVRSYPRSRTNPQFNAEVLAAELGRAGIGYRHVRALGGRRGPQTLAGPSPNALWRNAGFRNYADYALTPGFRAGFEALLDMARHHVCAVMCAEAPWWRCHRQIVADYLLAANADVAHVLGPGRVDAARLTPGAQVQPDGTVHYPTAQGSLI